MKKIFYTTIFFIGFIYISNAQEQIQRQRQEQQYYWSFNWEMSKALGDTKNFIESISFRGGSVEGRYFINEEATVTIGGYVALRTFYEKLSNEPPYEFELDDLEGDIYGEQILYLNTLPILANIHYYLSIGNDIKPYAGIGLGAIYSEQRTELGLKTIYADSWAIGAQPEIGIYIPVGELGSGLNLSAKYLYGSSAGDLDSLSMLTVAIGFGIMR